MPPLQFNCAAYVNEGIYALNEQCLTHIYGWSFQK